MKLDGAGRPLCWTEWVYSLFTATNGQVDPIRVAELTKGQVMILASQGKPAGFHWSNAKVHSSLKAAWQERQRLLREEKEFG